MNNFKLNNRIISFLKENKKDIKTPLYLYDEIEIVSSIKRLKSLYPKNSKLFYSLKANPNLSIAKMFCSNNLGIEITGEGEWQKCLEVGISTKDILCGGVAKSKDFLKRIASESPKGIVIESFSEWNRLKEVLLAEKFKIKFLLRVNPNVSFKGMNMALGSQFGVSIDDAKKIINESRLYDRADFLGFHFYFGSQRLKIEPIVFAMEKIEKIVLNCKNEGIQIKVVDVGLGCGIPYNNNEENLDHIELSIFMQDFWKRECWENIEVWGEAGRYLIASSGYFVAKVIEKKELFNETFIFLNGGLNVHNPGLGLGRIIRTPPDFYFLTKKDSIEQTKVNIVGNLCTPSDCFARNVSAPIIEEDDFILIPNSGAYTMTSAMWGFNTQPNFYEAIFDYKGNIKMIPRQTTLKITT